MFGAFLAEKSKSLARAKDEMLPMKCQSLFLDENGARRNYAHVKANYLGKNRRETARQSQPVTRAHIGNNFNRPTRLMARQLPHQV